MQRRELLALLAATGTAGCAAGYASERGGNGDGPVGEPAGGGVGSDSGGDGDFERLPLAEQGVPSTVCEEEPRADGIVAIAEPAFGPPGAWPEYTDGYRQLTDESTVIGLAADGRARAYPLTVLNVHEVVNDDFGGPVLVTYCPICQSGMVADRRVDGTAATFDVSGLLWKPPRINIAASEKEGRVFSDREEGVSNSGNLVMYDDVTGSYWSQMLAQAICGPRAGTDSGYGPPRSRPSGSGRPNTLVPRCCCRRRGRGSSIPLSPSDAGGPRASTVADGVGPRSE
jgi:hypothetical protein